MPSHGSPSFGQAAPFIADGTKALILLVEDLPSEVRERWTGKSGDMQALFRQAFLPPPVAISVEQTASGIVKVVQIQIGGGRNTDQMVEVARKDCTYINSDITQQNMPSGFGKLRTVTLEFRQFDHDPYTDEVTDWQHEPGYGPSGYEDGLRFREHDPEAQRKQPHVFIPENPWCVVDGFPYALLLWSRDGKRKVNLSRCVSRFQWGQNSLFARRKYLVI